MITAVPFSVCFLQNVIFLFILSRCLLYNSVYIVKYLLNMIIYIAFIIVVYSICYVYEYSDTD